MQAHRPVNRSSLCRLSAKRPASRCLHASIQARALRDVVPEPAQRAIIQLRTRIQQAQSPLRDWHAGVGAAVVATALLVAPGASQATDQAAVGGCLLQKCQTQLAGCLTDLSCFEDLICLNKCNGREDERNCQIKCGDQYEDSAVQTFNACAVSAEKCVPQQSTPSAYPVPPETSLDDSFDVSKFQGRWYITAGYNELFDTFDCQEHYFTSPEEGKIFGKINWRIQKPDGDFLERSTVQRFVQDEKHPSMLFNHGNEYLHYEDDWYVAAWKPDEYAFIYYKGNNDAWQGYGGATVYTRAKTFPEQYTEDMKAAAKSVGLKWEDFTLTDNSCGPHPQLAPFPFNLVKQFQQWEAGFVRELEGDFKSFGRGFTILEKDIERTLSEDEKLIEKEIKEATRFLNRMERNQSKAPTATIQPPSLQDLPHALPGATTCPFGDKK